MPKGLIRLVLLSAALLPTLAGCSRSAASTPAAPVPRPGGAGQARGDSGQAASARGQQTPRPYDQVVPRRARSDSGVFTVHTVDNKYLFEVPTSLLGRDLLLVSRIAGVAPGMGGFLPAGVSVEEQVVRLERLNDRVLLRKQSFSAVADDSLPIHRSVAANNFAPILAAFPIQAFGRDSATVVLDVTDFFQGDTPAISGLTAAQRRTYQVRRLDPARSSILRVRSYPENIEIRHIQTFDAAAPPADAATNTISLEMAQSLVLLPARPMRPRLADPRVGYFSVTQVNYGLDELKAASQTFIRRWRLEPRDPAAYARGELVEPVKPIVYYIDPATPARWRPFVRQGVEDWKAAFETAGFRNAIVARDPPSRTEDPEWDPEDSRYSVVRWAASLTRNAQGPSTSDPRTGEIIESDIVWYHNHLRSYRNWLMVQTGAANPAARSLAIDEDVIGETMRQVIAHEIGHALGLPHNMVSSSAYAVDSLRNAEFSRRMGVAPSVMDYARQNYIAQPEDGLRPLDFIRKIGPYDHYAINWGYRVLPQARTPADEKPILHRWILEKAADPMYRYLPQGGVFDPRAQTEDMGDDPMRADSLGLANLRRIVPNLVAWTTRPGEPYDDLAEVYGEALTQWNRYVGHVVAVVGGVHVVTKTADQNGPVYEVVPRLRQRQALAWLGREALEAPVWLTPPEIRTLIGDAAGFEALSRRQVAVLNALLDPRRMARLSQMEVAQPEQAYSLPEFLDDMGRAVWLDPSGGRAIDPYRRTLQRAYLARVKTLMTEEPSAPQGFGGQAPPPSLERSDIRPLLRAQLIRLRRQATNGAARSQDRVTQAHLEDMAERIRVVLEGRT